jgi:hypothetical protein
VLEFHVVVQATDKGGEMNDVCGSILIENLFCLHWIPQIGVLGGKEIPGLALLASESGAYGLGVDDMLYRITDKASATSDEDD